jgi:hypothetical protein
MWLFCVCGAELWLNKDYVFPILFNHDMMLFLQVHIAGKSSPFDEMQEALIISRFMCHTFF